MPGTLYIVATPIGNLEDITLRAIRILKESDLVACEDTRQTQKLLSHLGVEKKMVSYHEHNELTRSAEIVKQLEEGATVALVSDAGMPGISDPGYRLIGLAIRHHINVVPVPGASAFVAALAASGLPTDSFRFSGFLPAKSGQRRSQLEEISASPRTQVFYEAPHRLIEALRDVVEILGAARPVVVAREVTKIHEEFVRGHAADVLNDYESRPGEVKGEITLMIGRADAESAPPIQRKQDLKARLQAIMQEQALDEKQALKVLAKEAGVGKSELYRKLQQAK